MLCRFSPRGDCSHRLEHLLVEVLCGKKGNHRKIFTYLELEQQFLQQIITVNTIRMLFCLQMSVPLRRQAPYTNHLKMSAIISIKGIWKNLLHIINPLQLPLCNKHLDHIRSMINTTATASKAYMILRASFCMWRSTGPGATSAMLSRCWFASVIVQTDDLKAVYHLKNGTDVGMNRLYDLNLWEQPSRLSVWPANVSPDLSHRSLRLTAGALL